MHKKAFLLLFMVSCSLVGCDDHPSETIPKDNSVPIGRISEIDSGAPDAGTEDYVWIEHQELIPDDGEANDLFGSSVSLNGDTVVIGSRFDDNENGEDSGSAYIFVRTGDTWEEQQKLIAGDGEVGDSFGWSVSLSGDTAIVTASFDDDNGENSGSAYVFVRSGGSWIQKQKLLPNDGRASDLFGYEVSMSGDTSTIGAVYHDDNKGAVGAAYIFEYTTPMGDGESCGSDEQC